MTGGRRSVRLFGQRVRNARIPDVQRPLQRIDGRDQYQVPVRDGRGHLRQIEMLQHVRDENTGSMRVTVHGRQACVSGEALPRSRGPACSSVVHGTDNIAHAHPGGGSSLLLSLWIRPRPGVGLGMRTRGELVWPIADPPEPACRWHCSSPVRNSRSAAGSCRPRSASRPALKPLELQGCLRTRH
jgi:hypothetical protein